MTNMRPMIAGIALLVLVSGLSAQDKVNPVMDLKGKAFPEFKMKTLDEKEFSNKDFKDKITVINFWATWCSPEKAGIATLQKIHAEMKDQEVQMIGANTFERGVEGALDNGPKTAAEFVAENKVTYTNTYGNTDLALELGVRTIPTFVIIDKAGVVREVLVGFDEKKLRAAIDALKSD